MARRKSSLLDDLIDLIALLPWWGGVVLGVISYLGLHHVATLPVQVPAKAVAAGLAPQAIWRGLAMAGQYVVPFICLIGAVVSAWRRRERRQLMATAARSDAPGVLNGMTWRQFEKLVGEAFRQQGYTVIETGASGPDGGVDLVLKKSGETYLVQCKQWRAMRVGVEVVRELYGVMAARGAKGGFVVTSGRYTSEAQKFAHGRNVSLVDGTGLAQWIRQGNQGLIDPPMGEALETGGPVLSKLHESHAGANIPSCPKCSSPMVRRTARQGANAGKMFWGCPSYPACRGTRAE